MCDNGPSAYTCHQPRKIWHKIWALYNVETNYAWSLQMYTGKDTNCKPKKKIKDTTLSWNLRKMWKNTLVLFPMNWALVGTVWKNKTLLPAKILQLKSKPESYAHFLFDSEDKTTLVEYMPQKMNKLFCLARYIMTINKNKL